MNDNNTPETESCNNTLQDKILNLLENTPEGVLPKPIASVLNANKSTVRGYLRKLENESKVYRTCSHGPYKVVKPVHRDNELKVHNLYMYFPVDKIESKEAIEFPFGDIKIKIEFGKENSRINYYISHDWGMEYEEVLLVFEIVKQRTKQEIGIEITEEGTIVSSFELNVDYSGLRLDGMNCVTFYHFKGFLERIYTKDKKLRHEYKFSLPTPLSDIIKLMREDKSVYIKNYIEIPKRMERIENSMRYTNGSILRLVDEVRGIKEKLGVGEIIKTTKVNVNHFSESAPK